jgi:predicted DsbA family dithiol-disulfide isomerase
MKLKVTYYLDVISSWCFFSEPAWAELKKRYANQADFEWKIALMDATGMPISRAQMDWFYRRSGTIMRSVFKLNSDWLQPGRTEYLIRNLVSEAAKDFGVTDDRVRLALATVVLRDGKQADTWETATEIGAAAGGLDPARLLDRARSPEIEARIRASTAEFHALQVTQRPTFVMDNEIGDRAVFSGFARVAPLAAAMESMLDDLGAYESYAAHYGGPPAS